MKSQLQPWQFLLLILAGWINRTQQDAIEYLMTENRILREKLGKKRILLNNDQRRRLAVEGKVLGRKMMELATRRVHFAGCTANPDEAWICQTARNLTDGEDGFLRGKKYLIMDRDTKFSEAFRVILEPAGTKPYGCRRADPYLDAGAVG